MVGGDFEGGAVVVSCDESTAESAVGDDEIGRVVVEKLVENSVLRRSDFVAAAEFGGDLSPFCGVRDEAFHGDFGGLYWCEKSELDVLWQGESERVGGFAVICDNFYFEIVGKHTGEGGNKTLDATGSLKLHSDDSEAFHCGYLDGSRIPSILL